VAVVTIGATIQMSTASLALVEYKFVVADPDMAFSLKFKPGQTVGDAKKRIQERLSVEEIEDVRLLFAGKDLHDGFVLDRHSRPACRPASLNGSSVTD
jgi:hypothetical protein